MLNVSWKHILKTEWRNAIARVSLVLCFALSGALTSCTNNPLVGGINHVDDKQIGIGSIATTKYNTPQTIPGLTSITRVVSMNSANIGNAPICAIKSDGTYWCWGDNAFSLAGYDETAIRTVSGY